MSLKRAGRAAMNAFTSSEVTIRCVIAGREKKCAHVRERNSRLVFSESDMAERKRNSTGREVLPARPLRVAWLRARRTTRIRYRRIESRAASAGRSHQAGGSNCRVEASVHDDLLYPPSMSCYPFYRLLEFRMLLKSGCLA